MTEKVTANRRQFPRLDMKLTLTIQAVQRGEVAKKTKTQSENISAGGVAIGSNQKMRRGQMLMMNVFLPAKPNVGNAATLANTKLAENKQLSVAVLARVAYCTAVNSRQYRLGIQFLDLAKTERKILRKFLVQCKLLESQSSLYS